MPVRPEVARLNAWKAANPWRGDKRLCAGCGGLLGDAVYVAEGGGRVHAGHQLLGCLSEHGFNREEAGRDALELAWEHSRQDRPNRKRA